MSASVYQLIATVSAELAQSGISKNRNNKEQNYKFRGIDDVYNALAPVLSKHGLVVMPRILTRLQTERQSRSGAALFSVVVEAEFDFISAHDGSRHTVRMFGEAMDSADKATNKAMSAAYKYAAFQTFCIPTEGDNDADATTHETVAPPPAGYEQWLDDLGIVAEEGTAKLQEAWKASKAEYRKYLTTTSAAKWEQMKDKAEKVKVAA